MKKAGIPFEVVGYSEIDKFAIKLYELNHKKGYTRYELKNPLSNKEMQTMQEHEQKKVEAQKQKEADKLQKKENKTLKKRARRQKHKAKKNESEPSKETSTK